ncbi:hypothetical protein CEXT_61021 [Caerostris extrusa]|uniref:Uncharacterized protein n=1 Tax=Caerostris extrusa TaxID=172846 RepID=A0AAV4PD69_CAEEX|nr:hypothetical protein CEXT_61021 [Caerostris extrusa]
MRLPNVSQVTTSNMEIVTIRQKKMLKVWKPTLSSPNSNSPSDSFSSLVTVENLLSQTISSRAFCCLISNPALLTRTNLSSPSPLSNSVSIILPSNLAWPLNTFNHLTVLFVLSTGLSSPELSAIRSRIQHSLSVPSFLRSGYRVYPT